MPRSIAGICGVPFRKIVAHMDKSKKVGGKVLRTAHGFLELLSCGHEVMCKDYPDLFCCASQRRCYQCKAGGYESPKNKKLRG
jgi:hypothetical protein